MSRPVRRRLLPIPLQRARIEGGLWAERMRVNREATIPHVYRKCRERGRTEVWKLLVGPGRTGARSHQFWDSDVAKWMEAAAYSLAAFPDARLERQIDDLVDLMAAAQMDDGYLNSHFQLTAPANRWANLRDNHELYCAGHLMEAAVAYYEATGKRKFLDVMCRYADHIDRTFGPDKGKKRGYPGHEEIELALVKLHRATGEGRYLDLARFFIDERGREPKYFVAEARARGEGMPPWAGGLHYWQAHAPVREQTTAEGHSVRALYLYSGMADVAAETGDANLLSACRRLWRNIVRRRMYVTGSVGSSAHGERFTFDYDLPNETSYAETCDNIALLFWAHRMLQIEEDGEYADVMELALHNGVLA
ncbi:MAG: glycoside hydrolase family 127 protein, partial [Planctomycetota bacterium]